MGLAGIWWRIVALALALAASLVALPAAAEPIRPACHGFAAPGATPERWICGATGWSPTARVAWLRFDAASWGEAPPRRLVVTIGRFDSLTVTARTADGVAWTKVLRFADFAAL